MIKKYLTIATIVLMLFFTACSTTSGLEHQDVDIGKEIISFNYRLYEVPPLGELGHFDITINLIDLGYTGDKAQIQFKSTSSIEVDEEIIEFEFEDKSENLRFKISPKNLKEPIYLPYTGKIITTKGDVPFSGNLLLNRDQN